MIIITIIVLIQEMIDSILVRLPRYSLVGLCLAVLLLFVQLFTLGEYTMMDTVDNWIQSMILVALIDCATVIYQCIKEYNEEESE